MVREVAEADALLAKANADLPEGAAPLEFVEQSVRGLPSQPTKVLSTRVRPSEWYMESSDGKLQEKYHDNVVVDGDGLGGIVKFPGGTFDRQAPQDCRVVLRSVKTEQYVSGTPAFLPTPLAALLCLPGFAPGESALSADALLNIVQIAQAIRMGERGLTQKELAAEFGCSVEKVVRSLSAVGVRLEPKPFGMRPVTVRLSGAQVEGLRAVADLQGIRGVDRHSAIAEQALRRLGADAPLLRATMDPTFRPVFLEGDDVARLKDEAGKRGITPDALAGLIVSIVLRDRMVAAVIDG